MTCVLVARRRRRCNRWRRQRQRVQGQRAWAPSQAVAATRREPTHRDAAAAAALLARRRAAAAAAVAAQAAGINRFLVVTAVGAQPDASVFYSRVKGELERDLQKMDFSRLDILRPYISGIGASRIPDGYPLAQISGFL